MEKVLFRDVKITSPGSRHHGRQADVLVEAGKIKTIKDAGQIELPKGAQVCEGGHLSAGWLDMRTHLTDPGFEWKEDLESLSQAALAGGFSSVVTLPNTHPVIDNSGLVKSLRLRAKELPINILPCGTLSKGADGKDLAELYDMHKAGAVAFTDGIHPVESAGLLLRGMQYLKPFGGLLMNMSLDRTLAATEQVGESPASIRMGMKGIPAIAEELMLERDLKLLGYFPHRLHVGPITTAGAIDILRKVKSTYPGLTVETSALYLLLDDSENTAFHSHTKVFPPLREKTAIEALRKAVAEGIVDVVSSSHHPQSIEEKKHDFPTAAYGAETLESAFAAANTGLKAAKVPLDKLIACLTVNPRRILGLDAVKIEEGAVAELTHFDPEINWTLKKSDLRSKSSNNPLMGRKLTGRALHVYVRGELHKCQ
jgi:dihydroorotase